MYRFKLALAQMAVLLGIIILALGLGGSPAHAAWNSCPVVGAGHVLCLYDLTNGGNPWYAVVEQETPCFTLPVEWRNRASSGWNQSDDYRVFLYDGNTCNAGLIDMMFPESSVDSWGLQGNNDINSLYFELMWP